MNVIESEDYEHTRQRLMKDPIVIAMAKGIKALVLTSGWDIIAHGEAPKYKTDPWPTPRFEFMMACNKEYRSRGGTDGGHIGAIAEALLRLL